MSIFRDLLAIKTFRENQAESAMRAQSAAVREARKQREAAEAHLATLLKQGKTEELRLYHDLCERIVKLRDIDNVHQVIAMLRARETQQEQVVQAAIAAQTREAQRLDAARALHREASRQKSKFSDLADSHFLELQRKADQKEDLELEEAASIARERAEWDTHQPEDAV